MVGKYKVVTLCGSTRFKKEFLEAQARLTLEGYIVLSVCIYGHEDNDFHIDPEQKRMLDNMHLRKIDLSDEIFVVNVNGYIGETTASEIEYARRNGRIVKYLEQ